MAKQFSMFESTGYNDQEDFKAYAAEIALEEDETRRARLQAMLDYHRYNPELKASQANADLMAIADSCMRLQHAAGTHGLVFIEDVVDMLQRSAALLIHSRVDWLDTQTGELAGPISLGVAERLVSDNEGETVQGELREFVGSLFFNVWRVSQALEENDHRWLDPEWFPEENESEEN